MITTNAVIHESLTCNCARSQGPREPVDRAQETGMPKGIAQSPGEPRDKTHDTRELGGMELVDI